MSVNVRGQNLFMMTDRSDDPCGYPDTTSLEYRIAAAANWGYGYTNLLADIDQWKKSPYVTVETIGQSVQSRNILLLTITDSGALEKKKRIWIHARTHPSEVEGTYVTNEIISYLLSDASLAKTLRDSCIFTIVPMINPDGVELQLPRENANGIDIESNWNTFPHQPEVHALQNQFVRFMQSISPIRVSLNMHSAYTCKRYFVYHDIGGTSLGYTKLEQKFISQVQSHFPGGFENYNYFVSWVNATALQYPESWFWTNHRESVMALTYEDMNCAQHGMYDRTAYALLAGISDYLTILPKVNRIDPMIAGASFSLAQNYPNPFSQTTTIEFSIPRHTSSVGSTPRVTLNVYDKLGRKVQALVDEQLFPGTYRVTFQNLTRSAQIYFYQLKINDEIWTRIMTTVPS